MVDKSVAYHEGPQDSESVALLAALEHSGKLAVSLDRNAANRKSIPIRCSFVRKDNNPEQDPPLRKLVSAGGGRGGAVPVKLYAALIWKCARKPFDVKLPARKWAELLGLPEPTTKGARRVAHALHKLAEHNLILLEESHGEPSRVTLLDESGDGSPYELPSNAFSTRGGKRNLYFKVSTALWTSTQFQSLSTPGLAMLMILLEEGGYRATSDPLRQMFQQKLQGSEVWFTTENFPERYGISASMRSRGTKELESVGLLSTTRRPVGPRGVSMSFTTERLRKVYVLQGDAVIKEKESAAKGASSSSSE